MLGTQGSTLDGEALGRVVTAPEEAWGWVAWLPAVGPAAFWSLCVLGLLFERSI